MTPCISVATCVEGQCTGTPDKDDDADGHLDVACAGGDDCDDDPGACGANCFPGIDRPDTCDGMDNDCNGFIDEDPEFVWYHDADLDGYVALQDTVRECVDPDGSENRWVRTAGNLENDCDDDPDQCGANCSPGLSEESSASNCKDGQDNDCNGIIDLELACFDSAHPPRAVITGVVVATGIGEVIVLDAGDSWDREESISTLSFAWDADVDDSIDGRNVGFGHAFSTPGLHEIQLTVTDSTGMSGTAVTRVYVTASTPVAVSSPSQLASAVASGNQLLRLVGPQIISLADSITLTKSDLTIISDPGVWLDGEAVPDNCIMVVGSGNTLIGFNVANCGNDGIRVIGNNNAIINCHAKGVLDDGFHIQGDGNLIVGSWSESPLDDGIVAEGNGNRVGPANLAEFVGDDGVDTEGTDNEVLSNVLRDVASHAVQLRASGSYPVANTTIAGNLIIRSGLSAIQLSGDVYDVGGVTSTRIFNNTFHRPFSEAIEAESIVFLESRMSWDGAAIDIRNNIFVGGTGLLFAPSAPPNGTPILTNNLFFAGQGGSYCLGCSNETGNIFADPEYADPDQEDFSLLPSSPAVNAGVVVNYDANGGAAGDFNGNAHDLGALESPFP